MGIAMKSLTFPLIGAAALVVVGIIGGITMSSHNAQRAADAATLEQLKTGSAQLEQEAMSAASDAALSGSGARADRLAADTGIIEDLAERTMTWSDNAEYVTARESAMRAYELTEESVFMQSFLPPAPVNIDAQGNEYPFIDAAGLNSQAGAVTVNLLGVEGAVYSYMVLVEVQSTSSDGLGTASNVATMFVTIDPSGAVSDLSGYAATSRPLSTR